MYQILITTTNIPHYKLVNTIKHYYLVAELTIEQQTEHNNASTADLCSQPRTPGGDCDELYCVSVTQYWVNNTPILHYTILHYSMPVADLRFLKAGFCSAEECKVSSGPQL